MAAPRPALDELEREQPVDAVALEVALERQLARLRFDLHDGPQQQVHLLAQDLRLFREQLGPMIATHPERGRALGRLDDLEAQLVALDADLRGLSAAAAHSPLEEDSLAEALTGLVEAFCCRTGVAPVTQISGDVGRLTASQRIAVLSIVREALANIRRHAAAEHVEIRIDGGERAIRVQVRDDGCGFDPEVEGPAAAAGAGRLGLVGMRERSEMLGGRTAIRSTPGGPTVISALLPRWPPDRG